MLSVRPVLGAVLTAAAIAAAGCGSSSSGGADHAAPPAKTTAKAAPAAAAPATDGATTATATGPRPSKATYVRRADNVCRAARQVARSANSVVGKAFQAGDAARAADAIDNYTPMFAAQMTKLKALRQPRHTGTDEKVLTGLIKVMDGQVQALRDEATALRQQDNGALQDITKAQQQELEFADQLGKQYGFKVCGRAA
jgi:hypothetical protein